MTDEPDHSDPLEVPPTANQPAEEPDHLPAGELTDDDPKPEVDPD